VTMIEWKESELQAAAGWKAFKDGKALFEGGLVAQAKLSPDGWTGSVREGKRVLRLGVKAAPGGRFEARCACPENQATGALCAHAVATGLALLKPRASQPAANTSAQASSHAIRAAAPPAMAFELKLPPNWCEALRRGRLTVTLNPLPVVTPEPADEAVAHWLAGQGVSQPGGPLPLALDVVRLPGFLAASIDHPRISSGGKPISIFSEKRIQVFAEESNKDELKLVFSAGEIIWLGDEPWELDADSIARVGSSAPPPELAALLRRGLSGAPVRMPVKELLRCGPQWEDWLVFPEGSWLGDLKLLPAPVDFHLRIEGSLQQLDARLSAQYDGLPPLAPGQDDDRHFPRRRILVGLRIACRGALLVDR